MTRFAVPLVLAPALVLATPAAAQTQAAMTAGAAAEYRRADGQLNIAYGAARASARAPGAAAVLLDAQRAWLRFRDAECVAQSYGSRGGTIHATDELVCKTTLTRQRITQLQGGAR